MKKLLTAVLAFAFFAFSLTLNAQDEKAAPSPFSKVEQKVGTTDFTVEYSRPGVKDRKVFGELVPYDKRWRTGANAVTKLTINKDIKVEGKELPAGTYALFTTPGTSKWDVHFFEYGEGSPNAYNEAKPKLTVSVMPMNLGDVSVETFLIFFDQLRDESGTMMLAWDNVAVPVNLMVK
ncbi:DUF2911 domain-containing protein [Portibacter marinus]|uniref:DUF2911 domain-containing protein n=1 Tax=Portibacter marinus TaxID=2898660 RepID=UPI001F3579FC|nr:DUF2911 domain-containing protein [Portibacter marinus]